MRRSVLWSPHFGKPRYEHHARLNLGNQTNAKLTMWYLCNEGAGKYLHDIVSPGVDAVLSEGTVGWGVGRLGTEVIGNGSTIYNGFLRMAYGLPPPYTAMFHVTPTSLHNYGNIISSDYPLSGNFGLLTFGDGDWHWQLNAQTDLAAGAGSLVNNVSAVLTVTHNGVAGVSSGSGTCSLYQNGIFKIAATRTGNNTGGTTLEILGNTYWNRFFTGRLTSLQFWNRCLSAIEVAKLGASLFGEDSDPRLIIEPRRTWFLSVAPGAGGILLNPDLHGGFRSMRGGF
jgi:hypothetical protein